MSEKYKVADDKQPHFITCTVIGWVDVFSREIYKEKVVESLQYCQQHKGLIIYAWVIMTNHLHLIVSSQKNRISDIVRDFKKYTSKQILAQIENNEKESRRIWMMNMFGYAGRGNSENKDFQFWRNGYHPVALNSANRIKQRLNYLHQNPVKGGLVWQPQDYKYSSAIDYYTQEKGLLDIALLDY